MQRAGGTRLVGEGDALGEDPPHATRLRGGNEMLRALAAQAVGEGEVPFDPARIEPLWNRRQLVDDGVGAGLLDRAHDGVGIERVGDQRLGARGAQGVGLCLRARHARDVMASGDQRRHERLADGSGGAGEKDPHSPPGMPTS